MKKRGWISVGLFALVGGLFLASNACSAIERPDYVLLEKDGALEIRRYGDLTVVETQMRQRDNEDQSFRRLFAYISGENEGDQKIAMTVPVLMNPGDQGKMRFVVPGDVAKAGAPAARGEKVDVTVIKAGKFAVWDFSNGRKQATCDQALVDLKTRLQEKKLKTSGEALFAFYDPPIKPSPLCTFEVWLRLDEDEQD